MTQNTLRSQNMPHLRAVERYSPDGRTVRKENYPAGRPRCDSDALGQLVDIELGYDHIPCETAILNFPHFLEKHWLTKKLFNEFDTRLVNQGITPRSGTLVDATIIDAQP